MGLPAFASSGELTRASNSHNFAHGFRPRRDEEESGSTRRQRCLSRHVLVEIKEPNPEARTAGKALIAEAKKAGADHEAFIYVNNRLEGNALEAIDAMLADAV